MMSRFCQKLLDRPPPCSLPAHRLCALSYAAVLVGLLPPMAQLVLFRGMGTAGLHLAALIKRTPAELAAREE
jgi:hypothetical protein